jgi:ribosomal protein S27AE
MTRDEWDELGVWDEECPKCGHSFATFHTDWPDSDYSDALSHLEGGAISLYRPVHCYITEDEDAWDEYTCPRCNHQWTQG